MQEINNHQLEISALGGLTIQQGGKPLTGLGWRKVEALVIYLVCNPQPHSRQVLDAAPRMATVTALEDSCLLRLEQNSLYDLMASQIEVVREIIRVLSRRLLERMQDVLDLQAHIQELTESIKV